MSIKTRAWQRDLIEAALDQPFPTEQLKITTNIALNHIDHPSRVGGQMLDERTKLRLHAAAGWPYD